MDSVKVGSYFALTFPAPVGRCVTKSKLCVSHWLADGRMAPSVNGVVDKISPSKLRRVEGKNIRILQNKRFQLLLLAFGSVGLVQVEVVQQTLLVNGIRFFQGRGQKHPDTPKQELPVADAGLR